MTNFSGAFRTPVGDGLATPGTDGDGWDVNGEFGYTLTSGLSGHEGHTHQHLGDDWSTETAGTSAGQPVYSIASGTVFLTGDHGNTGFGKYVIVKHELPASNSSEPEVYFSIYAHLQSDSTLSEGEVIRAGDYIGPIGNTGTSASTGPHLHLEIVKMDEAEVSAYTNSRNADGLWGYRESSDLGTNTDTTEWLNPQEFIEAHYASIEFHNGFTQWFESGELIRGGFGSDDIYQGAGNDAVDGGDGVDIVVYNQAVSEYDIKRVGNTVLVTGPEGTDHLRDVEGLEFADATIQVSLLPEYSRVVWGIDADPDALNGSDDVMLLGGNAGSTPPLLLSDFGISESDVGSRSVWEIIWDFLSPTVAEASGFITLETPHRTLVIEDSFSEIEIAGHGAVTTESIVTGAIPDDHADDSSGSTAISLGAVNAFTSISGVREHGSDDDVYDFTLTAGQKIAILLWADSTENSALDPFVSVEFPNGVTQTNDDLSASSLTSFLSFTAPVSGTYTITASGVGSTTGAYLLSVTPLETDTTAGNLQTETNPATDSGSTSSWDWQGTSDDDGFPTPGWDPHKGDLDASNSLRGHNGDDRIEAGRGNDVVWGDSGNDSLYGEDGNDTLRGGTSRDTIRGGDGDDLIYGEDGDDRIYGDTSSTSDNGDDTIYGGDGEDRINGGRDDDYIKGEDDDDDIDGDSGNDELYGDRGNDTVDGGTGNDLIFGGRGDDILDGQEGHDRIAGEDGNDDIEGDEGDDRLYGGDDDDLLQGGSGNDLIHGENGNDTADFSDGNDGVVANLFDEIATSADLGNDTLYDIENLIGSDGNDVFDGDHEANILDGSKGDDAIRGHNGNDSILGGSDDDVLWGDAGDDTVLGEDDDDELRGGLGNDSLSGGSGDDHLRGEQDNDTIDGGTGIDTVFSWGEFDDFEIIEVAPGAIRITDLRSDGLEGVDNLTNVEFLEFFDRTVSVADLFAPAPVATNDLAETTADRVISVDAAANDQSNASNSWISTASIASGGGLVSVIGGQVVFDPNGEFQHLSASQAETVAISYTLETTGGQTVDGSITVEVSAAEDPSVTSDIRTFADGRVLVTEYVDGVRRSATMTDAVDAYSWTNYTNQYDDTGARVSQSYVYDNGNTAEITFAIGVRTQMVVTEPDGDTKTTLYDGAGQRDSFVFEDVSDTRIWTSFTNQYDDTGARVSQSYVYDNGNTAEITFANGVRTQMVVTEPDGDTKTTLYDGAGQRDSFVFEDVSDTRIWTSFTNQYDDTGALVSRTTVYDDDRVYLTEYANGQQVSRVEITPGIEREFRYVETFDDGTLNQDGWSYQYSVSEFGGSMHLEMTTTDQRSRAIFDFGESLSEMTLSYDAYIHAANNYFHGGSALSLTNADGVSVTAQLKVQRSNYGPDYGSDPANYDRPYLRISDPDGGSTTIYSSGQNSSAFFDDWTTIGISFSSESGRLEIDMESDGSPDLVFEHASLIGATAESYTFGTYGWWTGHYTKVDDLDVSGFIAPDDFLF